MTNVARLSSIGTCFAFEFDDNTNSSFSVSIGSTVFSNEFDENTSTTLSGNQRMSATSTGGLIVLDSINEIDPYGEISTNGLELHLDSVDSNINSQGTPQGQQVFTDNGTFTVPAGVTQVSAVVVGGGGGGGDATADDEPGAGGGGGGLSYGTFTVTSGESLTVTVGAGGNNGGTGGTGGTTSIARGATTLLSGGGGSGGSSTDGVSAGGGNGGSSGGTERDGGGTGGNGGSTSDSTTGAGGGGGAAGYSGNGGAGSNRGANNATAGAGGGGGGGGGGTSSLAGGGGGGVGLLGEGTNGAAATNGTGGGGGSNGDNGTTTTNSVGGSGGLYGGGGAGGRNDNNGGDGAAGAARIIYGTGRSYPSTLTTDQSGSSLIYFWEDISGNNRDAQFKNATNNPKEGSGTEARVDFDSSNNEYAVIDGDAVGSSSYNGVTGTAARTIIVGFKLDALAINSRPFSYGTDASGERFTFRLTTLNNFRVELGNGYTETDPITTTDLHVFAVVVPAGGSPTINDIRIWDDGIEQTLTTSGGTITISTSSANNVAIGGAIHEASPTYMNGQYIKVMIYSRELTDLEIKLIYRSFLRNIVGPRT